MDSFAAASALAPKIANEAFAAAEAIVRKALAGIGLSPTFVVGFSASQGPSGSAGFELSFKCTLQPGSVDDAEQSQAQPIVPLSAGQSMTPALGTETLHRSSADTQLQYDVTKRRPSVGVMIMPGTSSAAVAAPDSAVVSPPDLLRHGLLDEQRLAALSAQELQRVFASTLPAARSPEFYIAIGDLLMQKNEPLMAEDVTFQGSRQYVTNVRLRQLYGLALTQGGSPERAVAVLEALRDEAGPAFDDESGGLLARCYKDISQRQHNRAERLGSLRRAHGIYRAAYEKSGKASYYTGINTATMALLLGSEEEARSVAAEVVGICQRERASWGGNPPSGAYWVLATLGEASLIAGHTDDAVKFYGLAVDAAPGNFVKLSSTKRQLALLLEYVKIDDGVLRDAGAMSLARHVSVSSGMSMAELTRRPSFAAVLSEEDQRVAALTANARLQRRLGHFDRIFNLPRVAVFMSAEMHEGVLPAPGAQAIMAAQFDTVLQKVHAHSGYASPCTVADIIFLEAVKRRGGDIYVVLPAPLDVHLEACAERFAEIEELTGERFGPFGEGYSAAANEQAPVVAAAYKRLRGAQPLPGASSFTPEGVLELPKVARSVDASPRQSSSTWADTSEAASRPVRDSNLLRRLKAVIAAAARVDVSNDLCPETSVTNRHYCSLILNGLALARARNLGTSVERIYLTPNVLRVGQPVGLRAGGDEFVETVVQDVVTHVGPAAAVAAREPPSQQQPQRQQPQRPPAPPVDLTVDDRPRRASAPPTTAPAKPSAMFAAAAEAAVKVISELITGPARRRSSVAPDDAAAAARAETPEAGADRYLVSSPVNGRQSRASAAVGLPGAVIGADDEEPPGRSAAVTPPGFLSSLPGPDQGRLAGIRATRRVITTTAMKSGSMASRRRCSLDGGTLRLTKRALVASTNTAWAQSTVTTKLGDDEEDGFGGGGTGATSARGIAPGLASALGIRGAFDDVGPEAVVDPTAAAVFACIPSAVEQWIAQQQRFRVLFMDALLLRATAEEFGCARDVQVVGRWPELGALPVSPKAGAFSRRLMPIVAVPVPAPWAASRPAANPPPLVARVMGCWPEAAEAEIAAVTGDDPLTDVVASSPAAGGGAESAMRPRGASGAPPSWTAQRAAVPALGGAPRGILAGAFARGKAESAYGVAAARRQVIMAILFADIVGYSKMGEMQVLTFVERFLGSVAALLDALPSAGLRGCATKNTWGDGLYMVFSRVPDAGSFALLLSDLVQRVPWHKLGLPKSLSIRISLHAAPVHPVVDPITNKKDYSGVHTSRAARIEPITPPNCVYCSQAFAAISETLCVPQYECTYVGNVPLAKGYGLQPVYHVRWANSKAGRRLQGFLVENRAAVMPAWPGGESMGPGDDEGGAAP